MPHRQNNNVRREMSVRRRWTNDTKQIFKRLIAKRRSPQHSNRHIPAGKKDLEFRCVHTCTSNQHELLRLCAMGNPVLACPRGPYGSNSRDVCTHAAWPFKRLTQFTLSKVLVEIAFAICERPFALGKQHCQFLITSYNNTRLNQIHLGILSRC